MSETNNTPDPNDPLFLSPLIRLTRDAVAAMLSEGGIRPAGPDGSIGKVLINASEARQLVDLYYTMQEIRKRIANQVLSFDREVDVSKSHTAADYLLRQAEAMEKNVATFLDIFSSKHPISAWLQCVHGMGPILTAGVIAHLGSRPVPPTVGHWWRYAGLDPSQDWKKADELKSMWEQRPKDEDVETRARVIARVVGRDPETVIRDATVDFRTGESKTLTKAGAIKSLSRIPFNRPLKTLCWKIGDQFVKLGNREDAFYAKYYRQRKADEILRNERGDRADLAKRTLEEKPNHAQRTIYEKGMLPDGRVDLMARRATVKLFLSHLHHVWYLKENGCPPPHPFSISIQGHGHYIEPPYLHVFEHAA